MDYQEEMDKVIAEKMRDELALTVKKFCDGLKKLGYFPDAIEGSVTARKGLFAHIGKFVDYEGNLPDYMFRETHQGEDLNEYAQKVVKRRKLEIFKEIMSPPQV